MSEAPTLPIFLVDGHDVMAFESIESAVDFLEPIDVGARENEAYDADGRRLSVTVERRAQSRLRERLLGPDYGPIHISLAAATPSSQTVLASKLSEYLRRVTLTPSSDYDAMPLPELVALAAQVARVP